MRTALAVSSSLKTIYYVAEDNNYAMPDTGGPPGRIAEGEDLAIDPAGRMLVIHNSKGIVRIQLPSGAAEPIVASRRNAACGGEPVPHRRSS